MSSPHLNNLIIIGCMLTYTSVIFLGLDSGLSSIAAFPYICTARAWLLMAGFSLAFGAMFSKTWRVHSIFTDLKLNKKVRGRQVERYYYSSSFIIRSSFLLLYFQVIKDYQLFMVVGILLTIDLAIMTTWQIFDPFYRSTKTMEPRVSKYLWTKRGREGKRRRLLKKETKLDHGLWMYLTAAAVHL